MKNFLSDSALKAIENNVWRRDGYAGTSILEDKRTDQFMTLKEWEVEALSWPDDGFDDTFVMFSLAHLRPSILILEETTPSWQRPKF